jgi:hypothetical protein
VASEAHRQVDIRTITSPVKPQDYESSRHRAPDGCCPTCHFPRGELGYVRMNWPIGHMLFGKPIACPTCWPAPLGHAIGDLPHWARKVASMWGL